MISGKVSLNRNSVTLLPNGSLRSISRPANHNLEGSPIEVRDQAIYLTQFHPALSLESVNNATDEDAKAFSDTSTQKRGTFSQKPSQFQTYSYQNNHVNHSQKSSSISNSKVRENKQAHSMSSSQKNKTKKKDRGKHGKIPRQPHGYHMSRKSSQPAIEPEQLTANLLIPHDGIRVSHSQANLNRVDPRQYHTMNPSQ